MADGIVQFEQELVSYDNSLFTNAHDVVSLNPTVDGRGTFSHLGVRMEGLESSRHWNFKHTSNPDGSISFFRDENVVNNVETILKKPSTRGLIHGITFETSFYTNNPTKDVYSVVLIDELEKTSTKVIDRIKLEGDASKTINFPTPIPATRLKIQVGEGGLARIKAFGTPLPALPVPTNVLKGAKVVWASDASYGSPDLVLREEREGKIMAGWESKRHSARHAIVVKLTNPSTASKVLVDTYMHSLNAFQFITILAGNFDDQAKVEDITSSLPKWQLKFPEGKTEVIEDADINEFFEKKNTIPNVQYQHSVDPAGKWKVLLSTSQLKRDTLHEFTDLKGVGSFTHLAFVAIPDGGIHRLVVFGDKSN